MKNEFYLIVWLLVTLIFVAIKDFVGGDLTYKEVYVYIIVSIVTNFGFIIWDWRTHKKDEY